MRPYALGALLMINVSGCLNITELEDTWAPDIVFISPSDGSSHGNAATLSVCAHVFDEDPIDTLDVKLASSVDGPVDVDWALCAGGNFGADVSLSSLGLHELSISATDRSGNAATAKVSVTITESMNTAPRCAISEPSDQASVEAGVSVTFRANVSDDEQPADTLDASIDSDLDGELWLGAPDISGAIVTTFDSLSAGTHTLTLTVSDEELSTVECNLQVTVI